MKEYKEKAHSFSNWLTSIVISMFTYLIHARISNQFDSHLLWSFSFIMASFGLIFIFLWRLFSVLAAYLRVSLNKENKYYHCENWLESANELIFIAAFLSGVGCLVGSFFILWHELGFR